MNTPILTDTTSLLCVLCICLVPLAIAGLGLTNTGLTRSRSAAHAMLAVMCVFAISGLVYFVCGFAFAGGEGHRLVVNGKIWNWLGNGPFFLRKMDPNGPLALIMCFQLFSAGLAAIIPLGSGAERWRLGASCASSALLAAWVYPLFAHWVWGGGWLAQIGINYGIGRGFIDAAGSSTIHVTGGLTALSIIWIVGPRARKYSSSGMLNAIPGHNAVLVLFGCLVALVGWLGLNSAGAILFAGVSTGQIGLIVLNTVLSAGSAGLVAAVITRTRFGKTDASITANGWMGGLVASSAGCAFIKPAEAIILGFVAGGLVAYAVDLLEFHLRVDDPSGAVSVHALAGIWGTLAVGLFAQFPGNSNGQFLAQFVGVASQIGFILPLAYGLNWLLNLVYPYRVSLDGEQQGMDLHELGADAYPEFAVYAEEYTQR